MTGTTDAAVERADTALRMSGHHDKANLLRALLAERNAARQEASMLAASEAAHEAVRGLLGEHARVTFIDDAVRLALAAARAAALEEAAALIECGCEPEKRAAVVAVMRNGGHRWRLCSEGNCAAIDAAAIRALAAAGFAVVPSAELDDLRTSVVAFGAPWAATYARDHGLPDGHLHAVHYDALKLAGARMDDFTRHVAAATPPDAALARNGSDG